jgi:hypothetical protein
MRIALNLPQPYDLNASSIYAGRKPMRTLGCFILILSSLLCCNAVAQNDLTGTWQGKLAVSPNESMDIQFVLTKQADGSYKAVVSSPNASGIKDTPANTVQFANGKLTINVASLNGSYSGTADNGSIKGEWRQEGQVLPLVLTPYKKPELGINDLKKFVGVYELAPNFKIMITLEGNQLMTQASGQAKTPVYARSENVFFPKVVDAEIEFVKNDKGAVTHLLLRQNGQEIKGPRIGDQVAERKEMALSPKILAQYVGVYELQPKLDLMITLEGDHLMTQATGQAKFQVSAESETKFFLKAIDVQYEFVKDDKGVVTHMMFHQGPAEIKAPRKSDKVAERKEITLSPAILAKYVGAYELRPGFDMVITLEGDRLMMQPSGQPKIAAFSESETKFFLKDVDAQFEFLKDDKDTVTYMMFHQGPAETKAPKKK